MEYHMVHWQTLFQLFIRCIHINVIRIIYGRRSAMTQYSWQIKAPFNLIKVNNTEKGEADFIFSIWKFLVDVKTPGKKSHGRISLVNTLVYFRWKIYDSINCISLNLSDHSMILIMILQFWSWLLMLFVIYGDISSQLVSSI